MSTTVKFESPPGNELSTRNFDAGQLIRIGGHVTGLLGLGEPFQSVRLEIFDGFYPYFQETSTDLLGDFWFDIILPNVNSKATVRITTTFSVTGQDVVEIPIAIGAGVTPDPVPQPPEQGDTLGTALKWLPWIAIAAGILYVASWLPQKR